VAMVATAVTGVDYVVRAIRIRREGQAVRVSPVVVATAMASEEFPPPDEVVSS
jgi:hypothetical protein